MHLFININLIQLNRSNSLNRLIIYISLKHYIHIKYNYLSQLFMHSRYISETINYYLYQYSKRKYKGTLFHQLITICNNSERKYNLS